MKVRVVFGGIVLGALMSRGLAGQTPVLTDIEAPNPNIQSSVQLAGTTYGSGMVSYGPVGTPLVLTGSDLGATGIVQFIGYKNGAVDPGTTVQATATLWTSNMVFVSVPTGAVSGLVSLIVEGKTSNGMPFMVTPGLYAGSCPQFPPTTQLQITTSSLHDGTAGQSYSATLGAVGGTGILSWSIAGSPLPSGLLLNASTGTISGTPTGAAGPVNVTFEVTDSGSPRQTNEAMLSLTIQPQAMTPKPEMYTYSVNYDGVGNVTSYSDSINGTWNMVAGSGSGYDTLNRLFMAKQTPVSGPTQYFCWSYDSFGNRTQQEISSATFQSGSGGANSCNPQSSATVATDIASYGSNNQITSTNARGVTATPKYDGAGDVLYDGANTYLYDPDGRICAVKSVPVLGVVTMTGYIYDSEGRRVAKGTISIWGSCDPAANGFQLTQTYVLGLDGQELSLFDGSGNWQRSNVYGAGKQLATYDMISDPTSSTPSQVPAFHFELTDPLGTRRMQTSSVGQPETDCQSLPFGDQQYCFADQNAPATADDATPLHFTGKERDQESGNDYFGARYYSSAMGRFMSPDWSAKPEPVPYARLADPQSLNLYAYVGNNPLRGVDLDGHDWLFNLLQSQTASMQNAAFQAAQAAQQAQQQSQPQPGRQPNGSYIAPTGPGSEIAKITDPATPLPPLIGNGQCVTACKHFSGITAPTSQWQEGPAAANNPNLPIGTAIATFGSNGKYPTNGDQNSGIYMGQGKNGSILILDQWPAHAASGTPAHPPQIREMRFNDGSTLSNSAQAYHVIIVPAP